MLEPILDEHQIASCVLRLDRELRRLTPNYAYAKIGYKGGNTKPRPVRWGTDLWYQFSPEGTHYWIPFGLKFRRSGPLTMIVQVNPTTDGPFLKTSGLFARDPSTRLIHFLHTGRVAGGRKNVSQTKFLKFYKGRRMQVLAPDGTTRELLRVATLGSSHLRGDILRYVREVKKFKDKVTGKNKKQKKAKQHRPGSPKAKSPAAVNARRKGLGFSKQSYGRTKKRRKPGEVEITRAHGEVVNALADWVEQQYKGGSEIYNDQMVDLGRFNKHGVRHVFEVKTSTGTQALYTGIGQLMIHSSAKSSISRTLVLPKSKKPLKPDWAATIARLGIDVIRYKKIRKGVYEFQ